MTTRLRSSRRWFIATALVLAAATAPSYAQSPRDGFDPGTNGTVRAIAVHPNGTLVVGGAFTMIGGGTGTTARGNLALLNADGSVHGLLSDGANAPVSAIAIQPDGRIILAGDFTTVGGFSRNRIARLDQFLVETAFDPGANGPVTALAVQADGKIVVGGTFTTLGGQPRANIARLNANGTLDGSFNPGAGGPVLALAMQADGKIVVGGTFTTLGGQARGRLGRLNADGSADLAFTAGASYEDMFTVGSASVQSLAIQPDGKILVGGTFTTLAGVARRHLGRLNNDGSPDPVFTTGSANISPPFMFEFVPASISALTLQPDGKILVGGTFTSLGAANRQHIGRLNVDGSVDAFESTASNSVLTLAVAPDGKIIGGGAFGFLGPGPAGPSARAFIGRWYPDGLLDADFNLGSNAVVTTLAIQPDGKILVSGNFSQLGGVNRSRLGRLTAHGLVDAAFNPGAGNTAYALVVQPDGKILVGGVFTTLGGSTRNYIGRLNADGTLDNTFNPGANNPVYAIALQSDGKILVGGLFTTLGGSSRKHIGRLNADGSLDSTFNPGADNGVLTVTVQPNGKILVGGMFLALGGVTGTIPRTRIGRLTAGGAVDAFNPGANGTVWTLAVQPDESVLLGGAFTMVGGGTGTTTRNRLARVDRNGLLDAGFQAGANNDVYAIALQADGRILVAGTFTGLGGIAGTTLRNRIGRLTAAGSVDTTFDPNANSSVFALVQQADGKVMIGGDFTLVGGQARTRIARLSNADAAIQSVTASGGGTGLQWSRSGAAPEVSRVTFEGSADGTTYIPLGGAGRVAGGWGMGEVSLPGNQTFYIRARGFYDNGFGNGGGSIVESVRQIYIPRYTLTIAKIGTGTVTSGIGDISCGATCIATVNAGTIVQLTASAGAGFVFGAWGGGIGNQCGGSLTCNVTVNADLSVTAAFNFTIAPSALPNAQAGVAYQQALTASAGRAPYTYQVNAGSFPAGITLSAAGVISGTATTLGASSVDLFAIDADGVVGAAAYTLTVGCGVIMVSPSSLPVPVINNPYSQTVTQSGGVGATTFALAGGTLPAGLSLTASGGLIGTPTTEGAAAFTVAATDSLGCTGSRTYSTTVAGLPTMSLSLAAVNFGAVTSGAGTWTSQTPTQSLTLSQNGPGVVTWTAATNQPWITVSPASGSGPATLTIGAINSGSLPASGAVFGAVTITTTGGANSPSAAVNLTTILGEGALTNGLIDTPGEGQGNVTGSLAVTGWAVDDVGVAAVRLCRVAAAGEAPAAEVRCGGQPQVYIGDAVLVSGARPDIAAANPLKPLNDRAGWGYLLLTNFLPNQGNGTYTLAVHAEDYDGHSAPLGTRTITLTNATATAPLGAIDTPTQGGTVSGSAYVNFGWALTPQPKMIPVDGSTIQVFIDSLPVGALNQYNLARPDIEALFPGYVNTAGAVGYRTIDTTQLANGVHTIAWVATDNEGAASGIGSRYFTVANGAPGGGQMADPVTPAPYLTGPVLSTLRFAAPSVAIDGTSAPLGRLSSLDGIPVVSTRKVRLDSVGGVTLELSAERDGATYIGYEVQGSELRALPLGAQLDAGTGAFTWMPGLGFGGTRRLVFVRSIAGREELIRIDVAIGGSAVGR